MKKVMLVANKEWKSYFRSPAGYVFGGLMLLLTNWLYWNDVFVLGQADFSPFFNVLMYLLTLFVPAIVMGSIADEKKQGHWEVMMATPATEKDMVWGKFIGAMGYAATVLALTLPALASLMYLGTIDPGTVAAGYMGILLLTAAYVAIGILMSSLSNNAAVGFLGTVAVLLLGNLMGQETILGRLPWWLAAGMANLSLSGRTGNFFRGTISLADCLFFASLLWIILAVTINRLKNRER